MEINTGNLSGALWDVNALLNDVSEASDEMYDYVRELYIDRVGYGVLTYEFAHKLAEFIGDRRALDAGAGIGYLTDALVAGGLDCVGVDLHPRASARGRMSANVIQMDAAEAVGRYEPDVLILCWPTPPEDDRTEWAARALEAFEGEHVVVIGHHTQCATHRFWTGLFENWEDQGIDLQYDVSLHDNVGILDGCAVYARKQAKE